MIDPDRIADLLSVGIPGTHPGVIADREIAKQGN